MTLLIETSKAGRFAPTRERRRDIVGNGSRHREGRQVIKSEEADLHHIGSWLRRDFSNGFAEEQELIEVPGIRRIAVLRLVAERVETLRGDFQRSFFLDFLYDVLA